MAEVTIHGELIKDESDLHRVLAEGLDFGPFYGRNLAALRDRLLTDVERPATITWRDSERSRERLGSDLFERIVAIFEQAAAQDRAFGGIKRFEYFLS